MRVDYKSGYYNFGFNTSPTLCHGEPQEQKRNGTLGANIECDHVHGIRQQHSCG